MGEDAVVGRWRSEDNYVTVSLSTCGWPLAANLLPDLLSPLVSSNSLHCCKLPDNMDADWWPTDHRQRSSDAGSLLSNEIFFCDGGHVLHLWLQGTQNVGSATDKQNLCKKKLPFNIHRCPVANRPDSADLIWTSTVSIFSTTAGSPNDLTHQFIPTV